jgi:hypothetical protein
MVGHSKIEINTTRPKEQHSSEIQQKNAEQMIPEIKNVFLIVNHIIIDYKTKCSS